MRDQIHIKKSFFPKFSFFLLFIFFFFFSEVRCYDVNEMELLRRGIRDASLYYQVPESLLWAIAYVESGFNTRAVNVNKNRTRDYGAFQINERNLRRFGYTKEVAFHPYWSAYLAAYILKECILEVGYSWRAVDCYNKGSGRARENSQYVWKVFRAMQKVKQKETNLFFVKNFKERQDLWKGEK